MKESRFDPAGDLMIVHARLWGPRGGAPYLLRLAIDTGATHSLVLPEIIDELGYSPRDANTLSLDARDPIGPRSDRPQPGTQEACL